MKGRSGAPGTTYEDVEFQFLSLDHEVVQHGAVSVRGDTMVLDLPADEDLPPNLIAGKLRGHVFAGANSHREGDSDARAKWSDLDGVFVGQWVEDGVEYLFSFRLPRATKRKADSRRA